MKISEYLKKNFNLLNLESINEKFNELKEQFIEMGQLKSDFDIEKFTTKTTGSFIAHNFHFLMRQYSLALSEMRRMLIEKEEYERKILEVNKMIKQGIKKMRILAEHGEREKYTDLYIKELQNQLDLLEVTVTNKIMMCVRFEEMRKKLIEVNGGEAPTNEQFQKEEPEYWKWFLECKTLNQLKQAKTGVQEGIWDSVRLLEEEAVLNPDYQVKMLDENGLIAFKQEETRGRLR